MFAIFAALFFWFPKMFGFQLGERLGKWSFGAVPRFQLTFLPMHFMGIEGMARRVYTYAPIAHLAALNEIASAGAAVMAVGVLLFVANVVVSARKHVPAGNDPWGAFTLEWLTTSPPPEYNFTSLPAIRSERPAFDARHPELLPGGAA